MTNDPLREAQYQRFLKLTGCLYVLTQADYKTIKDFEDCASPKQLIWLVKSAAELGQVCRIVQDPYCAYILMNETQKDAVEPIMYKFLERVVDSLKEELYQLQSLPEQQTISSFEDMLLDKKDQDLSILLRKLRQPRLHKLEADLHLMLGNHAIALQKIEVCLPELIKLEDWQWVASALESKAFLTSDYAYLHTAVGLYRKRSISVPLVEALFRLTTSKQHALRAMAILQEASLSNEHGSLILL